MKRGRPARRTPLKRTGFKSLRRTELRSKKRLARRSKKQKARLDEYSKFRIQVLERDKYVCRACVLVRAGLLGRDAPVNGLEWQLQKIEVHHTEGRDGDHLCCLEECVTLCAFHHHYSKFAPHHRPKSWELIKDLVMPWIKS